MNKLLIISGPTATGKTALAVRVAKKYNGEIVSADSRQVYKGFDVLTGKDTPKGVMPTFHKNILLGSSNFDIVTYDISGVPIWMLDVAAPDVLFSISAYKQVAQDVIRDIQARGKLPIVVGGSGLYIQSLIEKIETIDIPQNVDLRNKLLDYHVDALRTHLQTLDADRLHDMNTSDSNNPRRLIRAIEVAIWQKEHQIQITDIPIYDVLWTGLTTDGETTQKFIRARVKKRWNAAIKEVKNLTKQDISIPSLTSLGIEPLLAYIKGKVSKENAQSMWSQEEISYAKRQMTWFKKQKDIVWFDAAATSLVSQVEKHIHSWYTNS